MKRHMLAVLLTVALIAAFCGCRSMHTTSGASATVTGYVMGYYTKSYAMPCAKAYDDVLRMLKVEKIVPYSKESGQTAALVQATLSDGRSLTIDIKATGTDTSSVSIRVGVLGDEERSNYFFEKLDKIVK